MSSAVQINTQQLGPTSFYTKPTSPLDAKQSFKEKHITDPSSNISKNQGYPIPSFFEYRASSKEPSSL